MSWQQYVDYLLGTKCVTKAAILGLSNGQVWATTPGFAVSAIEVGVLRNAYQNPEDLYSNGLIVAGMHFVFLRRSGESALYGRKGANSGGVCICKTLTALIVGYYENGIQPGSCNAVVEKLGDYLREQHY